MFDDLKTIIQSSINLEKKLFFIASPNPLVSANIIKDCGVKHVVGVYHSIRLHPAVEVFIREFFRDVVQHGLNVCKAYKNAKQSAMELGGREEWFCIFNNVIKNNLDYEESKLDKHI